MKHLPHRHEPKHDMPALVRWIFVDYLELIVGTGLVLALLVLHQTELMHITGVVTALLAVQKFSLRYSVEQAQERILREFEPLHRLELILDLEAQESVYTLEVLTKTYFGITQPELRQVKDRMLRDALDRMRQLAVRKTSEELSTGEYYEWLLPMLRDVKRGEKVIAVSLMFDTEWDDSEVERKFIEENIAASRRGATVDRVFVVPEANVEAMLDNAGVGSHRPRSGTGMSGSYATREYLERHDPELLRKVGDGFILIGDRVALVDRFGPNGEARGYVTLNPSELGSLATAHQRLKNMSRALPHTASGPKLLAGPR
jgi:hypothetical protein